MSNCSKHIGGFLTCALCIWKGILVIYYCNFLWLFRLPVPENAIYRTNRYLHFPKTYPILELLKYFSVEHPIYGTILYIINK